MNNGKTTNAPSINVPTNYPRNAPVTNTPTTNAVTDTPTTNAPTHSYTYAGKSFVDRHVVIGSSATPAIQPPVQQLNALGRRLSHLANLQAPSGSVNRTTSDSQTYSYVHPQQEQRRVHSSHPYLPTANININGPLLPGARLSFAARAKYNALKKYGLIKQENGTDWCVICTYPFSIYEPLRRLICDHVFHKECIDEWESKNMTCPVCRANALRSSSVPNTNQESGNSRSHNPSSTVTSTQTDIAIKVENVHNHKQMKEEPINN